MGGMEKAQARRTGKVYPCVDGVHVKAGLEKEKAGLLVVIGGLSVL